MKKKSKCFKRVAVLALAAILTAVPVLLTAMITEAANPVILAPENMVQFDIADENGNALEGVAYTVTNSAGVKVAGFGSNGDFQSYGSGIKSEDTFRVSWEKFESLVAPDKLDTTNGAIHYKYVFDGITHNYHSYWLDLSSGQEMDITLNIVPEKEIALTVPANTVMVNVDSQWANGIAEHELITNDTSYNMNSMAGTLTSVPMSTDGIVGVGYWAPNPNGGGGGAMHPTDYYTLPTGETQYVKVRMKASAVTSQYNDEGLHSAYLGDIAIASGVKDPGESVLWIVSGSVINMPVPDADGYIEFYVEASERKYQYRTSHHWRSGGGGGTSGSRIATEPVDMTVRAIDFPTDVNYMTFVPADTYTINVTSVPAGYEIPDPITFTVQDSQQFQTARIVVSGAHTHSYGTTYESDANNHWNECACGADGNVAAHSFEWITDKAATESEVGSKHEECSVCGYEKAPVEIPKLTPSTPAAPSTPSTPSTPAAPSTPAQADVKDEVPDTGDAFPMGIVVFGGLVLVSGLGLMVSYGKKKSDCK